jgi:hypothetical protein
VTAAAAVADAVGRIVRAHEAITDGELDFAQGLLADLEVDLVCWLEAARNVHATVNGLER